MASPKQNKYNKICIDRKHMQRYNNIMTMIYRCDKCKKIIKKSKFSVSFEDGNFMNRHSSDLCEKCTKPLRKYLYEFFNIRTKEENK